MKKTRNVLLGASGLLAAAAFSGLMAGSAVAEISSTGVNSASSSKIQVALAGSQAVFNDDAAAGKHECKGKNECKGNGGCKAGDNGCKGKNSCKGKGGCNTKEEHK